MCGLPGKAIPRHFAPAIVPLPGTLLPFHRRKNIFCEDLTHHGVGLRRVIEPSRNNDYQFRRRDYPRPLTAISECSRPSYRFITPLLNCPTATIDNRTVDFHRPGCAASATRRSSPRELPETRASAPYLNRVRQTLPSRVDIILDPKRQWRSASVLQPFVLRNTEWLK